MVWRCLIFNGVWCFTFIDVLRHIHWIVPVISTIRKHSTFRKCSLRCSKDTNMINTSLDLNPIERWSSKPKASVPRNMEKVWTDIKKRAESIPHQLTVAIKVKDVHIRYLHFVMICTKRCTNYFGQNIEFSNWSHLGCANAFFQLL